MDGRGTGCGTGATGILTAEERRRYEGLFSTRGIFETLQPLETGVDMFPKQKSPSYTIRTLLHWLCRVIGNAQSRLPWDGSTERRDQLLNSNARSG